MMGLREAATEDDQNWSILRTFTELHYRRRRAD